MVDRIVLAKKLASLALMPPTILMGASLPVLAAQVADDPDRIGGKVGGLYAINIFGAVVGVFLLYMQAARRLPLRSPTRRRVRRRRRLVRASP